MKKYYFIITLLTLLMVSVQGKTVIDDPDIKTDVSTNNLVFANGTLNYDYMNGFSNVITYDYGYQTKRMKGTINTSGGIYYKFHINAQTTDGVTCSVILPDGGRIYVPNNRELIYEYTTRTGDNRFEVEVEFTGRDQTGFIRLEIVEVIKDGKRLGYMTTGESFDLWLGPIRNI